MQSTRGYLIQHVAHFSFRDSSLVLYLVLKLLPLVTLGVLKSSVNLTIILVREEQCEESGRVL